MRRILRPAPVRTDAFSFRNESRHHQVVRRSVPAVLALGALVTAATASRVTAEGPTTTPSPPLAIRANLVGFPGAEGVQAIVLASRPVHGRVRVEDESGRVIQTIVLPRQSAAR